MGVAIDVEEIPPCPLAVVYLLHWFGELSRQRRSGMGMEPLAFAEIDAWARLYQRRLRRFEIRVLTHLDTLYRAAKARADEAERRRNGK